MAVGLAAVNFPELTGRIVDQASLLSPTQITQLTEALAQHEQQTTQQVVVATVTNLQGLPIEDYGYQLGRHWGIGQKDKNNGVILLVAPQERKVRIEVGYGLEGQLTDAVATQIIQQTILPNFKRGNMADGIVQGAQAILLVLGSDQTASGAASELSSGHRFASAEFYPVLIEFVEVFGLVILAIVVIFILFYFKEKSFPQRGGGSSSHWSSSASSRSSNSSSSSSSSSSGYSGGGGSFGGGGSSGSW
ncbi:MAG: TPM domain-containing protein [Gammaproteobacteria bacterium]|nr:TPM domain-containing protein [Gammaproteobacteria bacterium]